jgi:hypothetical protein
MTDLAEPFVHATGLGSIHPAIDHALSAFPAAEALQAAAAIRCACGPRLASGVPEAWTGSRLTGDGFPLEISFSTADPRLRFTVEPGGRGLPMRERLEFAASVVETVGGIGVPEATLSGLRAMQADTPLAYGAWVGCRTASSGTDCKLYVEVPRGAPMRVRSLVLDERDVVPRMLAYSPSGNSFEAYCRVPSLEPRHLPAVLEGIDGEARARWLLEFIEDAYGHRVRERLPGPSVGVSFLRHAQEKRVTLHFYARALWGSDSGIRRGFSRIARAIGWDDEAYLRVTAPLAERDEWRTYHGLFGITIDAAHCMFLSIGVRPIAP